MASGEAISQIIPPPVGGWNTRDALPRMGSEYAVEMVNFFPKRTSVDLRNGYRYHSKGIGSGAVIALATLKTASLYRLVAVGSNNTLYDATADSSSTANSIQGGISTANPFYYFQQYRDRLFVSTGANVIDAVYMWTGTGDFVGVTYTSTLSGAATRGLGPMTTYRSRLYFVQVRDPSGLVGTSIWYSGLDSIGGALTEFSFKSVLRFGGSAAFIGVITRAKDFSEDSLFCIITTSGEVLVYEGDWPAAAGWRLIGHYVIPRPLGLRAFFYVGADLHVITSQGVISIQAVLGGNVVGGRYSTISTNIDEAISEAATFALLDDPYWVGANYPKGGYTVINIPITSGSVSEQYVMNNLSGSWCRFTGQNAFCWEVFNDKLYFGGLSGRVFNADNGYYDEDPANEGAALTRSIKLRHSYNDLGDPTHNKQITLAQPIMYQSEGLALQMRADADFENVAATAADAIPVDNTDTAYKFYKPTANMDTVGTHFSMRIDQTVTTKRFSLNAIKVIYKPAGMVF